MAANWWWLSFAGESGWLGFCIVKDQDFLSAVRQARRLGCNPGGEVKGIEMPPGTEMPDPGKWANRLINTKEEAREFDLAFGGPGEIVRIPQGGEECVECGETPETFNYYVDGGDRFGKKGPN